MNSLSAMLSLPQVAEALGISRQAVYQAVKEKRIEATEVPLGNRSVFLVSKDEVRRFKRARSRAEKRREERAAAS